MTVAKSHDASTQDEAPTWAWPLHAFVAWLATLLGYITNFKRARRFRHDWRDSWEDLRHSEWLRDQLIAQGVAQLLNGEDIKLDDTKIDLIAPAAYGGPCPRTPFDMNRRFIALARWAADPEAIIRERYRRLLRNPLTAHASTDAARCAAAQHELVDLSRSHVALMLSSAQSARPSTCSAEAQRRREHERGLTKARGPPALPLFPTPHSLSASSRLRTRPHAATKPRTCTPSRNPL